MFFTLYPGMFRDDVRLIKSLLNKVLKSDLPLILNNKFDGQLQFAVIEFKFQNNLQPFNAAIDFQTFEFIKCSLSFEQLQQSLNESALQNCGDDSKWLREFFHKIAQQRKVSDETPLDNKAVDDLRGYLVKLSADPTFSKFIKAVIKNLPEKIYPDPNRLSIGTPVPKFNGTIVENFDRIRKDGKFTLASAINARADYRNNEIRFDRLYFKPYSEEIVNMMITSDRLYSSMIKADIGKGYEITQKLYTVFTLVHELIHAYYPPIPASRLATNHKQMAEVAKVALADLGIESRMTNMSDFSAYFNAALIQSCGKVKL